LKGKFKAEVKGHQCTFFEEPDLFTSTLMEWMAGLP